MAYNDLLKREIPKEWEVKKLSALANTYSGGTPQSKTPSYYVGGNIPWINSGELNEPFITTTTNYITELGLQNSSAKMYPANSIIIALYGATAGKASYISFAACSNQAVCGIMPRNNIYTQYLRLYVSSLYDYYVKVSSGSARDNISQDTVRNTLVACPPNMQLSKFASISNICCKIIVENLQEIDQLKRLRDELLPMLLNGQVNCDLSN